MAGLIIKSSCISVQRETWQDFVSCSMEGAALRSEHVGIAYG